MMVYPLQMLEDMYTRTRDEALTLLYHVLGYSKYLLCPPVDDARNIIDMGLVTFHHEVGLGMIQCVLIEVQQRMQVPGQSGIFIWIWSPVECDQSAGLQKKTWVKNNMGMCCAHNEGLRARRQHDHRQCPHTPVLQAIPDLNNRPVVFKLSCAICAMATLCTGQIARPSEMA